MDAPAVVAIGTLAAALVTGLFTVVARKIAPRVEKNAQIVEDALKMVAAYRQENRELRRRLEEYRNRE